jgi:hypothetical protein
MHKTESVTKTVTDTIHHFYCDGCGKLLGSTHEDQYGYYAGIGEFEIFWRVPDYGFIEFNKNFCEKCKQQFLDKLVTNLENIGFVNGDD